MTFARIDCPWQTRAATRPTRALICHLRTKLNSGMLIYYRILIISSKLGGKSFVLTVLQLRRYQLRVNQRDRTLPRSMQRSTMKLNELEQKPTISNSLQQAVQRQLIQLNESAGQSSNASSRNISHNTTEQDISSKSSSTKTTPNKLRRSTSMKGKISQLSKRVSKIR